jgi:hypothetical protein
MVAVVALCHNPSRSINDQGTYPHQIVIPICEIQFHYQLIVDLGCRCMHYIHRYTATATVLH